MAIDYTILIIFIGEYYINNYFEYVYCPQVVYAGRSASFCVFHGYIDDFNVNEETTQINIDFLYLIN